MSQFGLTKLFDMEWVRFSGLDGSPILLPPGTVPSAVEQFNDPDGRTWSKITMLAPASQPLVLTVAGTADESLSKLGEAASRLNMLGKKPTHLHLLDDT